MRLSEKYRREIKEAFSQVFGEGKIYLFGSRVDGRRKGGDIDLFLEIERGDDSAEKRRRFLARLKRRLGEQKIDVVFAKNPKRLIECEAKRWGIEL